jgi:hypothetical protein
MSDLFIPPDNPELSIDHQLALRTAAANPGRSFGEFYGPETIGLFLRTSFDQFATGSTIPHFLPLLAERFARQRLEAGPRRRPRPRRQTGRAVPVHPQRRPLADGPRLLHRPRHRPGYRLVRRQRTRPRD